MSLTVGNGILTETSPSEDLEVKLASRSARIGVVGLGYVGLPLVLLFSGEHFRVTGFDIDLEKIGKLSRGESYIYRITSGEVQQARMRGFCATDDFSRVAELDAIMICVPTPLTQHREPDLGYITSTAKSIAPYLKPGQLVILESTTYPGTTEEVLVPTLEEHSRDGLKALRDRDSVGGFYVAFSPEREDPGNDTIARKDIPKVIGGLNPRATELASILYRTIFRKTIPVSTPAVAEMTKLLENIYRCVNIALVNELKLLCLRMDIDIWEVIDAASTKPFGFQAFYPGPGLGGHCIPIDPFYLSWKAKQYDFSTRFIELAGEINTAMPYRVVDAITAALNVRNKAVNGARILILGVSYKKDVDDLRESPSLTIIELLQKVGAIISYNDKYFPVLRKGRSYDLQLESVPVENLTQYDCVVILADHSDYDYGRIVSESQLVIDTRNATRNFASLNVVKC
jgi:UDP-N-acetyl-D-glucosamine dehydrogenase